jgi:glycine oxidase
LAQSSEILIIGGGIIGLSIARELHRAGVRDIAILERHTLGCEASSAAAGMLAPQAEADSADLFFEFCRESRELYPDFAAGLRDETDIDIELDSTGTLYLAFNDADCEELRDRYHWQHSAQLEVQSLSSEELRRIEPHISPNTRMGLLFPNDWQVENRKLLGALRKFVELRDIAVHEHSNIDSLIVENGRVLGGISGSRRFLAENTILATGAWTSFIKLGTQMPPFEVKPIKGQMICLRPERPLFEHVIYTPRGYIVPRADGRVLVGSTVEDAGFEKDVTETGVESLRAVAVDIISDLANAGIVEKWAGLRPFVADGLPVIGGIPGFENLTVATGHYRNGILLAPLTAKIISSNLIHGERSRYLDAFGLRRFGASVNAVN